MTEAAFYFITCLFSEYFQVIPSTGIKSSQVILQTFVIRFNFRTQDFWAPNAKGYELKTPYVILFLLLIGLLSFIFSEGKKVAVISPIFLVLAALSIIALRFEVHAGDSMIEHNFDTRTGPGIYVTDGFTILFLFYSIAGYNLRKHYG